MTLCVLPQVVGEVTSSVTVTALPGVYGLLKAPRRTIRTGRLALIIIDLTHLQASRHRPSLHDQQPAQPAARRANVSCYGTSSWISWCTALSAGPSSDRD